MVALFFFLLFPLSVFAEVITNYYSTEAILNYDIDSATIAAGTAAGSLLAASVSESQYYDVTGDTWSNYWSNVQDISGSFVVSNLNYYHFRTNATLGELPDYLFEFTSSDGNSHLLDMSDIYSQLTPNDKVALFGMSNRWLLSTNVTFRYDNFDWLNAAGPVSDDISSANDMWTLQRPTPNIYFLRLSEEMFPYVSFEDAVPDLSDIDSSGLFGPLVDFIGGVFSESFERIEYLDLRKYTAYVCLFIYWGFLAVFFARNGALIFDEVASLFIGNHPHKED